VEAGGGVRNVTKVNQNKPVKWVTLLGMRKPKSWVTLQVGMDGFVLRQANLTGDKPRSILEREVIPNKWKHKRGDK